MMSVLSVQAQTVQSRFDEANNLALQGELTEAYAIYKTLEGEGQISGKLYYNMGVVAFQLDSLSVAKLYHIAAMRHNETRLQASEAITFLDSRFPQRIAELPKLPWEQFFDYLMRTFGLDILIASVVFVANTGIILYMLGWWIGRPRWLRGAYLSAALYTLTFLSISLYIDYREQRYRDGVIIEGQYAVKEEADPNSAVVSQAYEGFRFLVDLERSAQKPGWYYVRMSNGLYGWLPQASIRTI
jgi:hypothetical protein